MIPTSYADGYARARELDPDWAERYVQHTRIGDPPADVVIEDMASTCHPRRLHEVIAKALDSPSGGDVPDSLRRLLAGARQLPEWYEPELTAVASRAFRRNSDMIMMGLVCGSIVEGFSTQISKSFRIQGHLRDNGMRRLRQNMMHLAAQFIPGSLQPGSDGWRMSLRIRLVHAQSRRMLRNSAEWNFARHGMPLNAAHMMLGAAAFSARLMRHVALLGGDLTDEEREAYVATWRYTSILLGVPEEILFADQASAEHAFMIGGTCEPDFDDDSIILANSIINSAPILLGHRTLKARRTLAAMLYGVSRELIGEEAADQLRYPPRKNGISPVRLLRWRNRVDRYLRWLPGSRSPGRQFSQLLRAASPQAHEQS